MHTVWKFVLTGGPGGGKTTGIPTLKKFFENKGFKVFTIPEAATIVVSQLGLNPTDLSLYDFQNAIIETGFYLEDVVLKLANLFEQDVIILYDRALLDNKAYMPYQDFLKAIKEKGFSEQDIINRYDAVFHLVTAANGAEDFYSLSGIRTETPEVARELDDKTLKAWEVHPNLYVFDNSTDFDTKINHLISKANEIIQKN